MQTRWTIRIVLVITAWPLVVTAQELSPLFNGKDMTGWQVMEGPQDGWGAVDGTLTKTGKGGWAATKKPYTDFILDFEYKVPPAGNSGVFLRYPGSGHPTYTGMEIQILDDAAPVYKNIKPYQFTGSVYGTIPPAKKVAKPAGEWNHMRITCDQNYIFIEHNGEVIVDADMSKNEVLRSRSPKGLIGFQEHGSGIWYRNIKLADLAEQRAARSKWFRDAKFGMFIHWGVYSLMGEGEWIMNVKKIQVADYEKLYPQFNPTQFDPNAWVQLMKEAGIRYTTITTKHHDGFCMFDSKLTDYDIMSTPYKKDIIGMFTKACQQNNIPVAYYHSIMDWHHPDYLPRREWEKDTRPAGDHKLEDYLKYMRGQLQELLTNYGPIADVWFDGGWEHSAAELGSVLMNRKLRELQPQILINNRANTPEDFSTPEQHIPATGLRNADGSPQNWEACVTMTSMWWGYDKNETNYKSPQQLIRMLVDVVSKGGNLLLNVGPKPDGTIQPEFADRLRAIGNWMKVNGESIYGTTASPFRILPFYGRATVKDATLYIHAFEVPADGRLQLPGLKTNVKAAYLLADKAVKVAAAREGSDVILTWPKKDNQLLIPNPDVSTVVVELEATPDVEPFHIRQNADGSIDLPAMYSEIRAQHGQRAQYETYDGQLSVGYWTNKNDTVAWEFEATKPGKFDVEMTIACENGFEGSTYKVTIGKAAVTGTVPPTGKWTDFQAKTIGQLQIEAGKQTLTVSPDNIAKGALMNLRKVTLKPAK